MLLFGTGVAEIKFPKGRIYCFENLAFVFVEIASDFLGWVDYGMFELHFWMYGFSPLDHVEVELEELHPGLLVFDHENCDHARSASQMNQFSYNTVKSKTFWVKYHFLIPTIKNLSKMIARIYEGLISVPIPRTISVSEISTSP